MKLKALALSIMAGTAVMFIWQGISETALPWHRATMREIPDSTLTTINEIRRVAPTNGVYFSRYGALMAVRMAPDHADQTSTSSMVPMLVKQAALDLIVVGLLCLLVGFLADRSPLGVAKVASVAGGAMILAQELSQSIWYGFTVRWAMVNVIDQIFTFFITGLVVGAIMRRMTRDDPVSLPEGQGYKTTGGRITVPH